MSGIAGLEERAATGLLRTDERPQHAAEASRRSVLPVLEGRRVSFSGTRSSMDGRMLGQGVIGAAEPQSVSAADAAPRTDRSMQVLEYLVASIAVIAAIALAFVR